MPAPSQDEEAVKVAFEQVADWQVISEPTKATHLAASLPSQVLAEHGVVPVSHLGRIVP